MSFMVEAVNLDSDQRYFIDQESRDNNNFWIQGFAGSGKSVLLVHSISDKIQENPNVSICLVVFTNSLKEMFTAGMIEMQIPDQNVYLTTYHQFIRSHHQYDFIFCDEVQDLTKSVLLNMRERTDNLILAGDSNQSIYDKDPATQEIVINTNEIEELTKIKPYELTGIHRLTKSIINAVDILLPDMKIFEAKQLRNMDDVDIRLCEAISREQEVEYILDKAYDALAIDESVVILLPYHITISEFINIILKDKNIPIWNSQAEENINRWKKPDYSKLHAYLSRYNTDIEYIGNGYGNLYEATAKNKMIIMTYHSAKGLDFDNVFLPFVTEDTFYSYFTRTLFMVGITRSKSDLYLTYSGNLHQYGKIIESECLKIDINEKPSINSLDDDLDFDF